MTPRRRVSEQLASRKAATRWNGIAAVLEQRLRAELYSPSGLEL